MLNGLFGSPIHNIEELEAGGSLDTDGDQIYAQMAIIEDKPSNAKRLRFDCTGEFLLNYPIMIALYEVIGSNLKQIYQTRPVEK